MRPLNYDIRSYYRKHQVGETEDDGIVNPVYDTDGPYDIAFRAGSQSRILTEQGYSDAMTVYYCIADGVDCFRSGDILTDGTDDLFVITDVKTFPSEQTFYVRGIQ